MLCARAPELFAHSRGADGTAVYTLEAGVDRPAVIKALQRQDPEAVTWVVIHDVGRHDMDDICALEVLQSTTDSASACFLAVGPTSNCPTKAEERADVASRMLFPWRHKGTD